MDSDDTDENARLRAALKEALEMWDVCSKDANEQKCEPEAYATDAARIAELRKEFGL